MRRIGHCARAPSEAVWYASNLRRRSGTLRCMLELPRVLSWPLSRAASVPRATLLAALLVPLLLTNSGCMSWSYSRIAIGDGPQEYERLLPEEYVRRHEGAIHAMTTARDGSVEGLLLVIGSDRRVIGKWYAADLQRSWYRWSGTGYRLRGEVDAQRAGIAADASADLVRRCALELSEPATDNLSRETQEFFLRGMGPLDDALRAETAPADLAERGNGRWRYDWRE